jgi:hypothetical protein
VKPEHAEVLESEFAQVCKRLSPSGDLISSYFVRGCMGSCMRGCIISHFPRAGVQEAEEGRPGAGPSRCNKNCTGLAQIASLGPTLWLKIPIRALKLAHNLGLSCTIFVYLAQAFSRPGATMRVEISTPFVWGLSGKCQCCHFILSKVL